MPISGTLLKNQIRLNQEKKTANDANPNCNNDFLLRTGNMKTMTEMYSIHSK